MCLLTVHLHAKAPRLTGAQWRNAISNNPDGIGLVFPKGDKLQRVVMPTYEEYMGIAARPMLLHFRLATHGKVTQANMQPFLTHKGLGAIGHNGIFPKFGDKHRSDSRELAELLSERHPADYITDPNTRKLLEALCAASWSKLAVMFRHKRKGWRVAVLNSRAGKWEDGTWHSNVSYLTPKPFPALAPVASVSVPTVATKPEATKAKPAGEDDLVISKETVEAFSAKWCPMCEEGYSLSQPRDEWWGERCDICGRVIETPWVKC